MRFKLLVFVPVLLACGLHADGYDGWHMRGVRVLLSDGSVAEGCVIWRRPAVQKMMGVKNPVFPTSLTRMPKRDDISLYPDSIIREVMYPDSGIRVAIADPQSLRVADVRSIEARPSPHDGYYYGGIGGPPRVLPRSAELLQKEPLAMCVGSTETANIYWLSYNRYVTKEDLAPLCREPLVNYIGPSELTERNGLICLRFSYGL